MTSRNPGRCSSSALLLVGFFVVAVVVKAFANPGEIARVVATASGAIDDVVDFSTWIYSLTEVTPLFVIPLSPLSKGLPIAR